jgi:hypothetical protein
VPFYCLRSSVVIVWSLGATSFARVFVIVFIFMKTPTLPFNVSELLWRINNTISGPVIVRFHSIIFRLVDSSYSRYFLYFTTCVILDSGFQIDSLTVLPSTVVSRRPCHLGRERCLTSQQYNTEFPLRTGKPSSNTGFSNADTRENKCEQLFAERGKLDYTRSAKHAVVAYEKYHCCLKLGLFYSAYIRL